MDTIDEKDAPKEKGKSSRDIISVLWSRNIFINGVRTSVRLEKELWIAFEEIAEKENCTIHDLSSGVVFNKKNNTSLTSAIRVFITLYFRESSTDAGHKKAEHGVGKSIVTRTCQRFLAYQNSNIKKFKKKMYREPGTFIDLDS